MPIKPENMALYPGGSIKSPEWLAIRARIQTRAGDCCEECGVRNGAVGIRLWDGTLNDFFELGALYTPGETIVVETLTPPLGSRMGQFVTKSGFSSPVIKIVCTVAHIDGDLVDHSDENLRFLCQKCHNTLDAPSRAKNAAATRKARKPVTLLDLMLGHA